MKKLEEADEDMLKHQKKSLILFKSKIILQDIQIWCLNAF